MKQNILSGLGFIFCMLLPCILIAQSTITFQIDMSVQIKDSTFIPSKQNLYITGNQLPFSKTRTIRMEIKSPKDSIYVAKINFPSLVNGKQLVYNYFIKNNYKKIEELNSRSLILDNKDHILPIIGFNEFLR